MQVDETASSTSLKNSDKTVRLFSLSDFALCLLVTCMFVVNLSMQCNIVATVSSIGSVTKT